MCPLHREVGGRKLTVETRLAKELTEFSGDLSLEGLHFWKMAFSAMSHPASALTPSSQNKETAVSEAQKEQTELSPSSASGKKVILLPCKNPPSRERVQLWLEARRQYESLQKGRRDTKLQKKAPNVEGDQEKTEPPAVNVELCDRLSSIRTQRRKKRSLSLIITPVRSSACQSKSTQVSPLSEDGGTDIEQEGGDKDEHDGKATSPESPELPSWQQPSQSSPSGPERPSHHRQNSSEPQSPQLSNSPQAAGGPMSPSIIHVSNKEEEEKTSPLPLHSTPFLRRRRRSREELEPVCTPISGGKRGAASLSVFSITVSMFPVWGSTHHCRQVTVWMKTSASKSSLVCWKSHQVQVFAVFMDVFSPVTLVMSYHLHWNSVFMLWMCLPSICHLYGSDRADASADSESNCPSSL